jgi:hypothetical protein
MSRRMKRTSRGTGAAAIKGAIAGAVATWLMPSYGAAAEKVAGLAGRSLDDQQRKRVGSAIHWAIGIGTGALYAVLRRRFAGVGKLGGAAFGTAFWGVVDKGLVSGAHARGLAGHLTFGTVTDATLRVLDAVA